MDPLKDYRDRTKAISHLADALETLSAELRAQRMAEVETLVKTLQKPTQDVKTSLDNQT